jgi:hypothetical protein
MRSRDTTQETARSEDIDAHASARLLSGLLRYVASGPTQLLTRSGRGARKGADRTGSARISPGRARKGAVVRTARRSRRRCAGAVR